MFCQPGIDPDTIHVYAPAKLNLTLEVGPPRDDGYHPLASVMVPISLADELILTARGDDIIDLNIVMADPDGVPVRATDDNLVLRAARLLQSYVADRGAGRLGVSIRLEKHIPVAAGLAGGSADAAAVLVGLNRLWNLDLSEATLAQIGVQLGADVPFCIRSRAGLVEGIGEHYTPLAGVPKMPVVLLNPRVPLSTAEVFAQFDRMNPRAVLPGERTRKMVRALYNGAIEHVASLLYNDLEEPASSLLPEIRQMRDLLRDLGALGTLVTGSGPTVFALAGDASHARMLLRECQRQLPLRDQRWWAWAGWAGTIEWTDVASLLSARADERIRGTGVFTK